MVSSHNDDLLTGWAGIAAHIGCTPRQAQHRANIGELPTFTMGGRIVYARKSTLAKFFAEKEAGREGEIGIRVILADIIARLERLEAR